MDRPTHDELGRYIYYASELGSCTKLLIAKRMGYQPRVKEAGPDEEDRLQLVFDEGNLHEQAVLAKLKSMGANLYDFQREVRLEIGVPGAVIMGHIDAQGWGPKLWSDNRVVEIKSMGDESYKEVNRLGWDAGGFIPKYKWQISVYCWCLEQPGVLVVKNRNTGQILCLLVPQGGFYTYDDIQLRILEIETAADLGELPELCDKPMYPCPYEYLHLEDKVIRKDSEMDIWAKEYTTAQADKKAAEERMAEARKHIEEGLSDVNKLVTLNGTRITKYHVKGREGLDDKKVDTWLTKQGPYGELLRKQLSSERGGYSALRISYKADEDEGN